MRRVEELTVVKLGGSLLEEPRLRATALQAIATRWTAGDRLVVVHGGGKRIDASLSALGIPRRTHRGLRVTDAATLDVVVSVLAGLVNKSLVAELGARGIVSAGVSGVDGDTLWAEFHPGLDGVDLGYVGRVVASSPVLVETLLSADMLPVVASIAAGRNGTLLNVNADAAAAALATALGASRLVYFTDVEGLLDGEGQLVEQIGLEQARALLEESFVGGGMRPKLAACIDALSRGIPRVLLAGPGRHESVLSDGRGGTCLVAA